MLPQDKSIIVGILTIYALIVAYKDIIFRRTEQTEYVRLRDSNIVYFRPEIKSTRVTETTKILTKTTTTARPKTVIQNAVNALGRDSITILIFVSPQNNLIIFLIID